jgi:invasion protein IalB
MGCLAALSVLTILAVRSAMAAEAEPEPIWSRQCVKSPEGKDACFLQQFVIAMPQKAALLKAVFSYLGPKGGPRLELTTPLGILLQPGLTLSVDGRPPLSLPLAFCQTGGCQTVIDLDDAALTQFRHGRVAVVRYVNTDRKTVDLPLQLDGLDAALKTIKH